jgi:hypothetical protein
MAVPFVLSQNQINQLVIQIAQALGLVSGDGTNLTHQQIDALKSVISGTEPADVPATQGAFTGAYKTVSGWITDNSDPSNPHAIDGVDKSAWTFLRAGANINAGAATAEALTAREYTRVEYELRLGGGRRLFGDRPGQGMSSFDDSWTPILGSTIFLSDSALARSDRN